MKITFDLSTLNLSEGTHNIEIKATGHGWKDSDASITIVYDPSAVVLPAANIELDGDMLKIYDASGLATTATIYVDGVPVQSVAISNK